MPSKHLPSKGLFLGAVAALLPMAALASHPVLVKNAKQENACGGATCTAIAPGAYVTGQSVRLTATSDGQTCDSSTPSYALELEVRPVGTAFTGTGTHTSALMAKPSCVDQEYPFTVITLTPGQYIWQARETVGTAKGPWLQFNGGNLAFTLGNPTPAELVVEEVNLSNMVSGPTSLSFDLSPTFKNWGLTAANNFLWRAYLSQDRVKDASDLLIHTSATPFSVPPDSTAIATEAVTVTPKPGPGQYYVIVEADHTDVVPEFDETNNTTATANFFTSGVDLVATAVSGPANSGPDSSITLNVRYFNQGSDAAGTMEYKVYLSANNVVDTSDFVLYTGTRTMSGGETVNDNLTLTVPLTTPGGEFYYLLEVDSAKSITEASETNNVAVSAAKVKMEQADLEILDVALVDRLTGAPTPFGYFGQDGRLVVTLKNSGGADAKNFKIGVAISNDANLSLLSDTIAHDEPVALVASGQTKVITFDFPIPLKDRFFKDFKTGQYYLFAMADSFNDVGELNESNNNLPIGGQTPQPVTLRTPAQDYAVASVAAPPNGAVGEVIQGHRVIKNIGNEPGDPVRYRWFASANPIITTGDVPLLIVGAGGATSESGTVTLAKDAEDSKLELLRLPPTMATGTYYLGCIVDVDRQVPELDESNNAVASLTTMKVGPSSLRVETRQLPDAMVGRPYLVRLAASGEVGASTWALDTTGGPLPEGLTLASDGTLSGTPTVSTVTAVTVTLTNDSRLAAARLVLRVLPTTSQLEITTSALPPVVNTPGLLYEAVLGASGGVKPYVWRQLSGTLPSGLALSAAGVVAGTLRAGIPVGESLVGVEVLDSLGNRAVAGLAVRVVEPGAIVIKSLTIPNSLVQSDYITDLAAQNADGTPLAKPLAWSVAAGELPEGLRLDTQNGDRGIISGRPTVAGTYAFSIQVEDARGRADVVDFIMRVFPNRYQVGALELPRELHPGDEVNFIISAGTSSGGVRYFLHSGLLPPGLALAEDGTVSGTVAQEALGAYNFAVEARDPSGGGGIGAFALDVTLRPPKGCAAAGGGLLGGALALLPLLLRPRRKGS